MRHLKQLILGGFLLLWLAGFLLIAPSPVYRLLYLQSNQLSLDVPYQLFETVDWTHPHYYGNLARAFRTLTQQATTEVIYRYLDPESSLNTSAYHRYFNEYDMIWAYPHIIERTSDLDTIPDGAMVIISSTIPPEFECIVGEENLYLCQF